MPVEASAAGSTSPTFTAERSLPQRKSSRRQKSRAGQKDVPAPQPAVPGVSTQVKAFLSRVVAARIRDKLLDHVAVISVGFGK